MSRIQSILEKLAAEVSMSLSRAPKTGSQRKLDVQLRINNEEFVKVGTLAQEDGQFVFVYAEDFLRRNLPPLPGFPTDRERFHSPILWPFFQVRLPPTSRADVARVLKERHVDVNDIFEMLRVLGRRTLASPYELKVAG